MGCPASPFISEGKVRVTAEEKENNKREKKAFRIVGSLFSFMRVPPICRCQQGMLHVVALFVTGTMRRRHLPVMAFHSVPADFVVN